MAGGKMAPHYGRRIDYTALIGLHQVELLQTMRGCLLIRGSTSAGSLTKWIGGYVLSFGVCRYGTAAAADGTQEEEGDKSSSPPPVPPNLRIAFEFCADRISQS
jgi:hypothetical protein